MIDTATHAVVGSPITVGFNPQFIAISAVAPPALQGAVSRKVHAAVETFNLPLALAPFNGNDVVVGLTNVTNQQYVTVSLANVASSDGTVGGSGSVRIGFLQGDVNQNRVVTVSDLAQVNAQLAQLVTSANYLKDVNASGTLTVADKGITNTQVTKALPAP